MQFITQQHSLKLYRRVSILLVSLIFAIVALQAQSVDTVESQLSAANELRIKDSKSSIKPLYDVFLTANSKRYSPQCAKALAYLGWALYDSKYPDLGLQIFEYARGYSDNNDTQLRDLISLGMGACYSSLEAYDKGEELLLASLKQSKSDNNKQESMMIYAFLGDLYSNCAKDNKARESFEHSIQIAREIKDSLFESALICNLGAFDSKIEDAEQHYNQSINLCVKIDNKATECYAYCNLAEAYYNHGEYGKALHSLDMAERLLPYMTQTDKIGSHLHEIYGKIYSAQKDYASAYNHIVTANTLKQSQYNQLSIEREAYSLIVKDVVKQCEIYNLSTQEIRYKNTYQLLIAIIIALTLLISGYIYFHRKTKQQAKRLADQSNKIDSLTATQKEQESEITDNHRVMNYLYGYYSSRNILLEKISQMVKDAYKMPSAQLNPHLRNINNLIIQSYSNEKSNELFADLANEYKLFTDRLLAKFPALSKTDIQLAIYYRMGLSTRDIARLTGKQPQTVTMARYRLRKEINLPEDQDLTIYFNAI